MLHLIIVAFVTFFVTLFRQAVALIKENKTVVNVSWNVSLIGTFVAFEATFPRASGLTLSFGDMLFLYSVYVITFTAVIAGYWIFAIHLVQTINRLLEEQRREHEFKLRYRQLMAEYHQVFLRSYYA